ncbi:hypothetical protein LPJ66_007518 [Kickxella alabastrina]|uniref:Uncharacterized protein n=1 Tax=Kickxella alabastrina TaxID=61397 RepID=A0ACC1I8Q5_9FUNG|nr:hypothetical protein LPJ66_007518 [Kickxella alabastrina]
MSKRDTYEHNISQLLDDVNEQRQQAYRFARAMEQSILIDSGDNDSNDEYRIPPIKKSVSQPALVLDEYSITRGSCRSVHSTDSPPASFLDDFARDFVENYKPTHPPARILGRLTQHPCQRIKASRRDAESDVEANGGNGAGRGAPAKQIFCLPKDVDSRKFDTARHNYCTPTKSGARSQADSRRSPALPQGVYTQSNLETLRKPTNRIEIETPQRSDILRTRETPGIFSAHRAVEPQAHPVSQSESETHKNMSLSRKLDKHSRASEGESADLQPTLDESRMSKIDRAARMQLWDRFGTTDRFRPRKDDKDGERILELVRLAEQMTLTPKAGRPEQPQDTTVLGGHIPMLERNPPATLAPCNPPATQAPCNQTSYHMQAGTMCWIPGEWEHWATFVGTSAPLVDGPEMHRRLDWVHDRHIDAWQHGFRDEFLESGKLRRTYQTLGIELHAYPDGNIRRVASAEHRGQPCTATTLFFDNGDWQCTVEPHSDLYYFYCDERVWHYQNGPCSEYRYPDGRTERVDADGTSTVVHPSGEINVQLGM